MLFSEYGEKFRLSNLLICEKEKKIILSVSGWKNGGDGIWIYKFNQTHENCRIEVKEYALEDYQTALMRLNADMVSESSPDLIDLSDIDAAPYITKGAFVNLTPFFESSPETKKEDFISNILHLYGEDGKIYGVTTGFGIETLMGKESVFPDISQWTIKTMKETIVEMKPEAAILTTFFKKAKM